MGRHIYSPLDNTTRTFSFSTKGTETSIPLLIPHNTRHITYCLIMKVAIF